MAERVGLINLQPELRDLILELKSSLISNAEYTNVIFDKARQIAPANILTGPMELTQIEGDMRVNWLQNRIHAADWYTSESGDHVLTDMDDGIEIESNSIGEHSIYYDTTLRIRRGTGKWFLGFNITPEPGVSVTLRFTDLIGYSVNSAVQTEYGDIGIIIDSSLIDIVAEFTRFRFIINFTGANQYLYIYEPKLYRLNTDEASITLTDAIKKYRYLDGIKAIENPSINAYGPNLWDGMFDEGEIPVDGTNYTLALTANYRTTRFFPVVPGTQVSISTGTYNLIRWQGINSNGDIVYMGSTQTLSVPIDTIAIRICYQSSGDYSPMITYGTNLSKPYDKHLASNSMIPVTLRKINDYKDIAKVDMIEIDSTNNAYDRVLRVDHKIDTLRIDPARLSNFVDGTYSDIYSTNILDITNGSGGWFPHTYYIEYNGMPVPYSYPSGDSEENIGTMVVDETGRLVVYVPKGIISSMEEFELYMSGIVIYYVRNDNRIEYYPMKDFYIVENGTMICDSRWGYPAKMNFKAPINTGAIFENIVYKLASSIPEGEVYVGKVRMLATKWVETFDKYKPYSYSIKEEDIGSFSITEQMRFKLIVDPLSNPRESSKLISVNESFQGELLVYANYQPYIDLVADVYIMRR